MPDYVHTVLVAIFTLETQQRGFPQPVEKESSYLIRATETKKL